MKKRIKSAFGWVLARIAWWCLGAAVVDVTALHAVRTHHERSIIENDTLKRENDRLLAENATLQAQAATYAPKHWRKAVLS